MLTFKTLSFNFFHLCSCLLSIQISKALHPLLTKYFNTGETQLYAVRSIEVHIIIPINAFYYSNILLFSPVPLRVFASSLLVYTWLIIEVLNKRQGVNKLNMVNEVLNNCFKKTPNKQHTYGVVHNPWHDPNMFWVFLQLENAYFLKHKYSVDSNLIT